MTKTWVTPASQRASKKAKDVVYMPGGEADECSCLAVDVAGMDGPDNVLGRESEEELDLN